MLVIDDVPRLVAPYAGAWIEILAYDGVFTGSDVAPYAGAWIEIPFMPEIYYFAKSRSLRGSVD